MQLADIKGQARDESKKELLKSGSRQKDIWASSFMPITGRMIFESMVNLRHRQNRSMEILDPNRHLQKRKSPLSKPLPVGVSLSSDKRREALKPPFPGREGGKGG
ncbi:MAG: DUF5674 family protein [Nostoc sp.]|uniref:DUF5674 family protein n=1 Tax=Nostoc sp. TaxID=1180 RepID=UPI002FF6E2B9